MSVEVTATIAAADANGTVQVSAIAASEDLALQIIRSQLPPGWQIRSHTMARTAGPSGHPDWPGSNGLQPSWSPRLALVRGGCRSVRCGRLGR